MACMQRRWRKTLGIAVVMSLWCSLGLAQVVDMSDSWLVKKLNDSACDSLFVISEIERDSTVVTGISLSPAVVAWYGQHPETQGQTEYFLAEGAYKCAFAKDTMALFLKYSLSKFQETYAFDTRLTESQLVNREYRKAWAELRLAELTNPMQTVAIKRHLQKALLSLQSPLLRNHPGSFQVVADYLNAEILLQQFKLQYNEVAARGPADLNAGVHNMIADLQSIKGSLKDIGVGIVAQDGLVDVEPIAFSSAVHIKTLEVALLIARLQIMLSLPSDAVMTEIEILLGDEETSLSPEYNLEYVRLQLLRDDIVPAVFRGMIETIEDSSRQAFISGWSLLFESNWDEVFRTGGKLRTSDPQWKYWLAKAQAIQGSEFVRKKGGHYNSAELFQQYLQSAVVPGDSFFRDDATLHLLEARFLNAVNVGNRTEQKSQITAVRDDLILFRPQHLELKERVHLLEQMINVYGVKIQSVSMGGSDALVALTKGAATASSHALASRFLDKIQNLLNQFRQKTNKYSPDMVAFFTSVKDYVYVHWNTGTDPQCEKMLKRAMDRLDAISPGSSYYQEGQYLAAVCAKEIATFFDSSESARNDAIDRLTAVSLKTGNVRALYHLSDIHYVMNDSQNGAPLAQMVKRIIGDKLGTQAVDDVFYNAADILSQGQFSIPTINLPVSGGKAFAISHFSYPHATLQDHPGLYLEKFATHDFLVGAQAKILHRTLLEFYSFPVAVYPATNMVDGWLLNSCNPTISSGINDAPMQVRTALKMVVMTNSTANVLFDGIQLRATVGSGIFEVKDLEGGSIHSLKVTSPGYFPFFEDHKFTGSPFDPSLEFLYLATKTAYSPDPSEIPEAGLVVAGGNNKIFSWEESTLPKFLQENTGFEVRDFVLSGNYYYYINATTNAIGRVNIQAHGSGQTFITGYGGHSFKSLEGIAMDSQGNIYVTDFGNHHVVVFDATGKYQRHFGTADGETPLQFPTRLVLEQDHKGFTHDGVVFRRPSFLYVADWNGVHRMDLYGHFIDTIAIPGHKNMKPGDFYGIGINGYGPEAELIVLKRNGEEALKYTASQTH